MMEAGCSQILILAVMLQSSNGCLCFKVMEQKTPSDGKEGAGQPAAPEVSSCFLNPMSSNMVDSSPLKDRTDSEPQRKPAKPTETAPDPAAGVARRPSQSAGLPQKAGDGEEKRDQSKEEPPLEEGRLPFCCSCRFLSGGGDCYSLAMYRQQPQSPWSTCSC